MSKKIKNLIFEIFVIILSLIVIIPLFMIFMGSFKDPEAAARLDMSLPVKWNIIENYTELFKSANLLLAFKNTLTVTVVSIVLLTIVSAMAAFVFQRRKNKAFAFSYNAILCGLIIPISIVPTYYMTKMLHLNSTILGVCLVYVATQLSVATFLFYGYYKSIPIQIDESAIIDGCGIGRLFFNIIFPLMRPITFTVVILGFMSIWNDFQIAVYYLASARKQTLVLTMFYFFGQKKSYWNLIYADVVVTSLPVVIIYMFLQRYIIAGMAMGAVKG